MVTTNVVVQQSAILVTANNPDDRSWTCSIQFNWSHEQFGTRIPGQPPVNTTAQIAPKSNGVIFTLQGAYVNIRIEGQANISVS